VVGQLIHVDEGMAKRVAAGLRLESKIQPAATKVPARSRVEPSPALSIIGKAPETLKGRAIGCLVSDGADGELVDALRTAVEKEGAKLKIVAPYVGGTKTADGKMLEVDMRIDGGPSIFFDAVALIVSDAGATELARDAAAVDFIADAFNHLKVLGYATAAEPLLHRAGITAELADEGVIPLANVGGVAGFIAAAKKMRVWDREPKVRNIP
jgi:catalase